jgi:hypothetical protein
MADGDRAAVDVELGRIEAEFLADGQRWAAKASLASTRSRSFTVQPAFFSALLRGGIGPMPMTSAGSTPVVAHDTMRASGLRPRFLASSAVISTSAAAPSLMPEALPAVTVPSLLKAGAAWPASHTVVP